MSTSMHAGDVLVERYRLDDLLAEAGTGRFWRAHDLVLHRPVAVHILADDDARAAPLLEAARRAGPVDDRRLLRVLDAEDADGRCFVVNEWGQGESLDILLVREGPVAPRRAAWLVAEVADSIAVAHEAGLAHGCLTPENVLVDQHGQVKIIGFGVEAALRGLPPDRVHVDEIDLAGLLYCALTGKWAGVSHSAVPPAPEVHGEVLRPRRVRAGIPRALDTLCDEVLNPQEHGSSEAPHLSARRISDLLHEFVGDMTGTQPSVAVPRSDPETPDTLDDLDEDGSDAPGSPAAPVESAPTSEVPAVTDDAGLDSTAVAPGSAVPDSTVPDSAVPDKAVPDDVPVEQQPPTADEGPRAATDLPTEAGMPVFHDDDDEVDWLRARADKPAPPPPLAEPEPRPLFAPDPPEGEPVRRPRAGSRAAANPDYWPWDSSQDSSRRTGGRDTGGWSSGVSQTGGWGDDSWGTGDGFDDTSDAVPGRSTFRLAMIVGICLLVGVAAVFAYQLGLKPPVIGNDDEPTPTTSSSPTAAEPTAFTDLSATDLDPQGSPPKEENPDQVPNALDGDPATAWTTSTYKQNFGPAGLKTGVGLVVDLGSTRAVRRIVVDTGDGQTSFASYVTGEPPSGIAGLTPVGTTSGTGEQTIDLDEAVSGRYVTIWLTLLPPVDGGFRGSINEVQVLG